MSEDSKVPEFLVFSAEDVAIADQKNSTGYAVGSLRLYLQQLIFCKKGSYRTFVTNLDKLLCIEKLPMTTKGSPVCIKTKTFLLVIFIFTNDRECIEFCHYLEEFIPRHYEQLPCFFTALQDQEISLNLNDDFQLMGLPTNDWMMIINEDLCSSYPRIVFVPAQSTHELLKNCANFRSGKRLPVLTYLHENGAAICRSSQPLVGFSGRCIDDEIHLRNIALASPGEKIVYIADIRPMINAVANKAQGKGYESERTYSNVSYSFLGVENIHVMRECLHRMIFCYNEITPALIGEWIKHVVNIIDSAVFVVNKIKCQANVLVHCSDGWDRTSQTCSLASLILQPRYRTIDGFKNLIFRDWLSFGFRFTDRCQHLYSTDPREAAPIFLLFLECVWQLQQLNPTAFEFNERLLVLLHEHTVSCSYGDFIGNSSAERLKIQNNFVLPSFWVEVCENEKANIINPFYKEEKGWIIIPTVKTCRFWWRVYYRFSTYLIRPADSLNEIALRLKQRIRFLKYMKTKKSSDCDNAFCFSFYDDKSKKTEEFYVQCEATSKWSNYISELRCSCVQFFDSNRTVRNCCRCGNLYCMQCMMKSLDSQGDDAFNCYLCKNCFFATSMNKCEDF